MLRELFEITVDWTLRASLVFAVAGFACWLLRGGSASLRAATWRAAFAFAVAIPVVAAVAPGLPWLPAERAPSNVALALPETHAVPLAAPRPTLEVAGLEPVTEREGAPTAALPATPTPTAPKVRPAAVAAFGWLLGAALLLLSLGRGFVRARRIAQDASPTGRELEGARVVVSDAAEAPFVLDARPFARPVLVLSDRDRDARIVESHEGQHLVRRDGPWFLFARAAAAILWPTPLVWFALRRLRRESERACDDAVLRSGVRASDYAAELVSRAPSAAALPMPAMSAHRRAALSERVEAIVDAGADRRSLGARGAAALVAVSALVGLPFATVERADAQEPAGETSTADGRVAQARMSGLAQLLTMQDPATGAWRGDVGYKLNQSWRVTAEDVPHVGVTGLALEALVLGGMQAGEGRTGDAIERAAQWLMKSQGEDGRFGAHGTRMRAHAQALSGLAYASLAGVDVPFEPLKAGVEFTLGAMSESGHGWRFVPHSKDVDVLETAHQVAALEVCRATFSRYLGVEDFGHWIIELDESLSSVYAWVEGLRLAEEGFGPAGSFRYQSSAKSRVTGNTTAAGIYVTSMAGTGDWRTSLAAFEALHGRHDRSKAPWAGHFLTWDAELLAGRAIGGPGACCRLGHEHEARYEAFLADQRERVIGRTTGPGRWTCTEGTGDAYVTAIACILLADL